MDRTEIMERIDNRIEELWDEHYTHMVSQETYDAVEKHIDDLHYIYDLLKGEVVRVICSDCLETFEINQDEEKWYKDKGFGLPKRCKLCREKRKAAKNNA